MGDKQGMSFTPRSGDTHVIGEDGEAVNVDAQARGVAATVVTDAPLAGSGDGNQIESGAGEQSPAKRGKAAS